MPILTGLLLLSGSDIHKPPSSGKPAPKVAWSEGEVITSGSSLLIRQVPPRRRHRPARPRA
jgi:hypothetical protein